jgi:hypothetical protein
MNFLTAPRVLESLMAVVRLGRSFTIGVLDGR